MKLLPPLILLLATPFALADFSIKETPGQHIDIQNNDGKLVARVMTAHDASSKESRLETYKVYTHIFDQDGNEPITKGAGGDFTHHRGIFLGWSKTKFANKTVDSWHMNGCVQVFQKIIDSKLDTEGANLTILVHWQTDDGQVFLKEERTQIFRQLKTEDGSFLQVDLQSKFNAPIADVELKGDPEHAGCQFRPSQEVAKNKSAKYLFHQDGIDPKKDKDLPWVAESFKISDKEYFVQHLSHPSIPKGNTYSAYRDYGRFGAYCIATVPKDSSLTLAYSIIIGEGKLPERSVFEKHYQTLISTKQ